MNKPRALYNTVLAASLALALAACGAKVEVAPASIGKLMTKDGYREGVIGTSKFRLDACVTYCDNLVLLNIADQANTESMEIFMPEDKLKLRIAIRTNLTINPKKAESLFNTVAPSKALDSRTSVIEREQVYKTYAQQVILTETREYLSQYTIAEVASSMEKVNSDLRARLSKSLEERTPFSVRYVGITDIKYPDIITDAQENAAKRREQIQSEEAQREIDKVRLERELQEAQLQRRIDVEKAEADAQVDATRAAALTPTVLKLRELEIEQSRIKAWNGAYPTTIAGEGSGLLFNMK